MERNGYNNIPNESLSDLDRSSSRNGRNYVPEVTDVMSESNIIDLPLNPSVLSAGLYFMNLIARGYLNCTPLSARTPAMMTITRLKIQSAARRKNPMTTSMRAAEMRE